MVLTKEEVGRGESQLVYEMEKLKSVCLFPMNKLVYGVRLVDLTRN